MNLSRFVIACYLAVLLLQSVWIGLLPAPLGRQNWLLALVATLPLLLPLRGILAGKVRGMTWGGYLLVFYFVIGVTEAWSNPAQLGPALLQACLAVLYIIGLVMMTRRLRQLH
jgi:uncharacterized membrane protein